MARFWISQSKGCWLDLFEQQGFRGRSLRLFGPASYVNLWIGPEDWADEVRSLVVGPCAYAQCFEELNFQKSVVWLTPNQRLQDVSELPAAEELDSLVLFDRPPFASEPGFESDARWHGGNIQRIDAAAVARRPSSQSGTGFS